MKAIAAIILLLANFISLPSHACRRQEGWTPPPPLSVKEAFAAADWVFEGKFRSGKKIERSFDFETVFTRLKSWKGPRDSEARTLTMHSSCGLYPYENRTISPAGVHSADTDEKPAFIFYQISTKSFLEVAVNAKTRAELKALSGDHGKD